MQRLTGLSGALVLAAGLAVTAVSASAKTVVIRAGLAAPDTAGRMLLRDYADEFDSLFRRNGIDPISDDAITQLGGMNSFIAREEITHYLRYQASQSSLGVRFEVHLYSTGYRVDSTALNEEEVGEDSFFLAPGNVHVALQKLEEEVYRHILPFVRFYQTSGDSPRLIAGCIWPDPAALQQESKDITISYHNDLRRPPFGTRYAILGIDTPPLYQAWCVDGDTSPALSRGSQYVVSGFLTGNGGRSIILTWSAAGASQPITVTVDARGADVAEINSRLAEKIRELEAND